MFKKNDQTCNAPKLKELPAEFSEQVTYNGLEGKRILDVLKASLPQLAKQTASNSYNNSDAVKSITLASSLHDALSPVIDKLNSNYGYNGQAGSFRNVLEAAGITRDWRVESKCGSENMQTHELYADVDVEIHVVVSRKLKDKKFLASKGVK